MFHAFQSPDKSSKKNDSSSSKKKTSNIDYLKMLRGSTLFGEMNEPAAQMMVDEEEDKLAQKKTIQKSASEEEELMQGKLVQKSAPEEEELMQGKMVQHQKEDELQMKSESGGAKDSVQSSHATTQMPEGVQSKMENSFGTSFGGVNIHQNDNSATQMGALAYTQGNNVHFAPGQYNPESSKGQELLGHELTHVVQQRQGRVQPTKQGKGMAVNDSPELENEADVLGKRATEGKNVGVAGKGSGVQRSENEASNNTFTVPKGWNLSKIAEHLGVRIVDLKELNRTKLKQWGDVEGFYAGEVIRVPTNTLNNTTEPEFTEIGESKINASLEKATQSSDPLSGLLQTLLAFPMDYFLGSTAGSKVSATFSVEIPTGLGTAVSVVFGGGFEQERKADGKTLVSHKLDSNLGVKVSLDPEKFGLPKSGKVEGEGKLFSFFEVTAADLNDAVNLIYYGLYKLGRSMGDKSNDFGAVMASGGGTLLPSSAIYFGLNLMFGGKGEGAKVGAIDRIQDSSYAENNVAALEAEIFGKNKKNNFDENNPNEVAFGGGVEFSGSASVADNEAKAGLKGTVKNVINSKTLNYTGNGGAQDSDFFDDYKIGGIVLKQLELSGGISAQGNALEGKHVFTWGPNMENSKKLGNKGNKSDNSQWSFLQYEYELMGKIGSLAKLGNEKTRILFAQIIEKTVASYKNNKSKASSNDPNANLPDIPAAAISKNVLTELGAAVASDKAKTSIKSGVVDVVDELTIAIKLTVDNSQKNRKTSMVLTIGNEKKIEIDAKIAKLTFVDFDVLGQYQLFEN